MLGLYFFKAENIKQRNYSLAFLFSWGLHFPSDAHSNEVYNWLGVQVQGSPDVILSSAPDVMVQPKLLVKSEPIDDSYNLH